MSLMSSFSDYIETNQDWTDAIGERTFPVQAPSGTEEPWSVYRLKKEERDYAVDGPAELMMATIEFKIEAALYREAHELAKLLSTILDGYRGTMGDIDVHHIRFFDSRDGEIQDEVLNLYSVICDISVWYRHA